MWLVSLIVGNWQRIVIYGALILAALGVAAGWGYHRGVQKLWDYQAEQLKEALKIIVKIEKVKEIVRVPYIKREIEIVEVVRVVEKEVANVPVRAACNITAGWLRLHDYAAAGQDRPLDGAVDDPSDTTVTEAQALGVIVKNYGQYHQITNDLRACRSFVRGVTEVTSQ